MCCHSAKQLCGTGNVRRGICSKLAPQCSYCLLVAAAVGELVHSVASMACFALLACLARYLGCLLACHNYSHLSKKSKLLCFSAPYVVTMYVEYVFPIRQQQKESFVMAKVQLFVDRSIRRVLTQPRTSIVYSSRQQAMAVFGGAATYSASFKSRRKRRT